MKLIYSLIFSTCVAFLPQAQTAHSQTNNYNFKKILPGKWRAFNTKCLIEYKFKNNLKFTFNNTCAHQEKTTGTAIISNNNSFSLRHDNKKIFRAIYNGNYFIIKYDKETEYMFEKLKF